MSRPCEVVSGVRRYALPGGTAALLHPDRQRLFLLNPTAHFLWRVLARFGGSRLPSALVSRFGIPLDQAQRDVAATLTEWQAFGLLGNMAPAAISPPLKERRGGVPEQLLYEERVRLGTLVVNVRAAERIAHRLMPLLQHLRTDAVPSDLDCVLQTSAEGTGSLTINGVTRVDRQQDSVLIGAFYQALLEHLHPATRWSAMIHAGAVAKDDNAVIVAGPSGSGKSTLVAYLATRGFEYLADDLVALTPDGAVTPFPLPVGVKSGGAKALAAFYRQIDVRSPGDVQYIAQDENFLAPPRPAKMLLFPNYVADAATSIHALSIEDAVARLLNDRIFFGYPIGEDAVSEFFHWLRDAERWALTYSRFEEAERCVAQIMHA